MKLGTSTGSLTNHLNANCSIPLDNIVVGETGATLLFWTDRNAATVVDMFQQGKYTYLVIQEDHAKLVGEYLSQDYQYSRNPEGRLSTWKVTDKGFKQVRKNLETGRWVKHPGGGLMVGRREHYYDYSF